MTEPLSRKALRCRTRDMLIAAGVAGGNVAASRNKPLMAATLPMALVYTARETGASTTNAGPPSFDTTIELIIDAAVATPDEDEEADDEVELDDALDDLADAILEATLESADWLEDIEAIQQFDIVKHPAGADGKPVLGGLRISMQVSIGIVTYNPDLSTPFLTLGAKPVTAGEITRPFGVDIDGDGTPDIEFENPIAQ